jgi:hypothetical protein
VKFADFNTKENRNLPVAHNLQYLFAETSGESISKRAAVHLCALGALEQAKKEMRLAASGQLSSQGHGYHQAMVLLHKTARGWSQAFRHTTATQAFTSFDKEIDRYIEELRNFVSDLTRGATNEVRRRVMGIQLLADTPSHPCPPSHDLSTLTMTRSAPLAEGLSNRA